MDFGKDHLAASTCAAFLTDYSNAEWAREAASGQEAAR